VKLERRVAPLIASYTIEGRKAVQILADAFGNALERAKPVKGASRPPAVTIAEEDVVSVVHAGRLVEHTPVRARRGKELGKAFGLGVAHHVGSLIEIEAVAFPAAERRKGTMRFNETAGSMAKDSVFNAAAVVRAIDGIDPYDYDLHVNIVGGGNIDGPSAGLAIFLALHSALVKSPLRQDVAMTGEVSISGKVRAVGGITEKVYAARAAGMRMVLIPKENERELRAGFSGIDAVPVSTVDEALDVLNLRRRKAV
jgi:ATP-dependent Lon protease